MVRRGYISFPYGDSRYIYDSTTNSIQRIDPAVDLILDDYWILSRDALRHRYQHRLTPDTFNSAIARVDEMVHKRGMLQPPAERSFRRFLDRNYLQSCLSNRLNQLCLHLTEQCSQRCTYCINSGHYTGEYRHNNNQMSWDIARRTIDYFLPRTDPNSTPGIAFFGGEPLLQWDLIKRCVRYIRKNYIFLDNLTLSIPTNLGLLTPRTLDFIVGNQIFLQVSLDGPQSIHDSARVLANGLGTHARVMAALSSIRDKYPDYFARRVSISCAVNKHNDPAVIFQYFNAELFDGVRIFFNPIREDDAGFYTVSEKCASRYEDRLDEIVAAYVRSRLDKSRFNNTLFKSIFNKLERLENSGPVSDASANEMPTYICLPGIKKLYVGADGTFYPCEQFRLEECRIGDYESGILLEKVQRLLDLYVAFCEEFCSHCWASRLCSHCFVDFIHKGRISRDEKLANCRREKEQILLTLKRSIHIRENQS